MIAAPAPGFEQFGEVFQPLLGKSAPARDNVATVSHVHSMCHEPARKEKNGRRRNRTNQSDVMGIFCGKLEQCPATLLSTRQPLPESLGNTALSSLFTVKRSIGMAELRRLQIRRSVARAAFH